jgi:dTDP-4-amino-4,6-dideoxygalactose transaminase
MADYKGVEPSQVAAVNSATAALHVSMIAAGIGPGDEVITTPMTFCATVNAIIHSGATPVLADVDPATMNIDPEKVAAAVTTKTRAIPCRSILQAGCATWTRSTCDRQTT